MVGSGCLVVVVWLWLWWAAPGQTLDPDLSDLSLLSLDKLIAVKRSLTLTHSLQSPDVPQDEGFLNDTLSMSPGALPLRGPMTRGGPPVPIWMEEESWMESHSSHPSTKGKKLSAIFYGTVTVLAFLAFGGYLLCLILHVLKQKKAALTMTLLTTEEPLARARRAADAHLTTSEDAYLALRRLAEGYARYNHRCLQSEAQNSTR